MPKAQPAFTAPQLTIAERIAAAKSAAAEEAARAAAATRAAESNRMSLACARLRELLRTELGIMQTPDNAELVRMSPTFKDERSGYTRFVVLQVQGYWFGITMPDMSSSFEKALAERTLDMVYRCPNGHVQGYGYRYASGTWDEVLLEGAAKQAALAVEGGCYPCVAEGKARSQRQQVIDAVRLGSREQATAVVTALTSDYISDRALRAALRAANEAW